MNMLTKVLFVIMAPMSIAMAQTQTINFENFKTGDPPSGWIATRTGSGKAKWTVERDDSAPSKPNVLKQSGQATYPVCIKDDTSLKDGFVEVKFKPVSGKEDQAGGVIWRAKDANNSTSLAPMRWKTTSRSTTPSRVAAPRRSARV